MTLIEALEQRKRGAVIKHTHMFNIYESHISHLQDEPLKILEIGVYNGGSLFMWRNYFPKAKIIGIDIDPYCERFESVEDDIHIRLGDQSNKQFLLSLIEEFGNFDFIIDDGGHENHQTITSFEVLFPCLNENGIYVVEDTFFSYYPNYSCDKDYSTSVTHPDGTIEKSVPLNIIKKEYSKKDTTMEFFKNMCDSLNAWAFKEGGEGAKEAGELVVKGEWNEYDKNLYALHFYDGMIIAQKYPRPNKKSFGESKWYPHV